MQPQPLEPADTIATTMTQARPSEPNSAPERGPNAAGEAAERRERIDRYVPAEIEPRWQKRWEDDGLYRARDDDPRPKYYFLTMYPYPSGDLHTGHWYAETPPDTKARYLRMRGYNVMFPYGFDA